MCEYDFMGIWNMSIGAHIVLMNIMETDALLHMSSVVLVNKTAFFLEIHS